MTDLEKKEEVELEEVADRDAASSRTELNPKTRQQEHHEELTQVKKWKLIATLMCILCFIFLILLIALAERLSGTDTSASSEEEASTITTCSSINDVEWGSEIEPILPSKYGFWQTIIPDPDKSAAIESVIGMQTVHTALLPSGKVLLFSGSAWRNKKSQLPDNGTYPNTVNPISPKGLFNLYKDPFEWNKQEEYYSQVNFNGIYDPDANTFFRVPHPLPIQPNPDNTSQFMPTDLFCSGQHHVRDGNVLWIGGTQYYYPYRTGNRATHIFNWTKEAITDWTQFDWTEMPLETSEFYPFVFSGLTHRGRWYPHAVPLLDGRLVVFSGFIGYDAINDNIMYEFETNKEVEFFYYDNFLNDADDDTWWKHINVENMTGSPFATALDEDQRPPIADEPCSDPTSCRQKRAYNYDAFKLYPNNYLLADGRIYLTREGDWNSLRTVGATAIRRVNYTYFMHLDGTYDAPNVSWSRGPDRPETIVMSGTTVMDPNSGNINRFGGMPITTGGTMLPSLLSIDDIAAFDDFDTIDVDNNLTNNADDPSLLRRSIANQYAGSRGTRTFDLYTIPEDIDDIGKWTEVDPYYLGDSINDDRTMHYALILPTKEILIINGGNYDFYAGVLNPLLLTPIYDNVTNNFTGKYTRTRMATARQARLYHSGAILLPDGRIMTYGGNAARATIDIPASEWDENYDYPSDYNGQLKPNFDRVDRYTYFYTDSKIANGPDSTPSENWIMEMFYPPYLFIDEDRGRTEIVDLDCTDCSYTVSSTLKGKTYYLVQSGYTYNIELDNLPSSSCDMASGSLVIIKLGLVTHGWDSGQRLYDIAFDVDGSDEIMFIAADATEINLPPAYYNMFYVDCDGKPSVAIPVRFDDDASTPF